MPKNLRAVNLQFPLGGIDKSGSFRNQAPYTTPHAVNVRGTDVFEGRARGGQRAGLEKAFYEQLGSGAPVLGLAQVDTVSETTGAFRDRDTFDGGSLGTGWSQASWLSETPGVTADLSTTATVSFLTATTHAGMVRSALGLTSASAYDIWVYLYPWGLDWNGTFEIYLRMDNTTPVLTTEGVLVSLTLDGTNGAYSGSLVEYNSGTPTLYSLTSGNHGTTKPGWLRVSVSTNTITVYWQETQLISQAVTAHSGTRMGLGMASNAAANVCVCSEWLVTGVPSAAEKGSTRRSYLCAISGGKFYAERSVGRWTEVSGTSFSTNHRIMMVQRGQLLYICDYDASDTTTLKTYNPKTNAIANWTAATGTIPTSPTILTRYRDRAVLAFGHNWYMSRVGDWTDWDYSQTDALRAAAGNNSDAGVPGEEITACIPSGDQYMIMGCMNSTWILRGDPAYGGQLTAISRDFGVVDRFAYCYGPAKEIYVLSGQGLMVIPEGGSGIEFLSRDKLPRELMKVDTQVYDVSMMYRDRGVHIFLTSRTGIAGQHWYYRQGGFWQDTFTHNHEPIVAWNYLTDRSLNMGPIVGCYDGYVRRFNELSENDDGTAISSSVIVGPFRMTGDDFHDGQIVKVIGTLGGLSGDVTVETLTADDHYAIPTATAHQISYTWTGAGLQPVYMPRARGGSGAIKLSSTGNRSWVIEKLVVQTAAGGMQRITSA